MLSRAPAHCLLPSPVFVAGQDFQKGLNVNGTQKKLAAAGIATLACITFALTSAKQQTFPKHDLLGIVPNMDRDQVRKVSTSRRWECAVSPSNAVIACKTEAGGLTIQFADGTNSATVTGAEIQLANRDRLSFNDTVKAVSTQYSRQPVSVSTDRADWKLDDTLTLVLARNDAFTLSLSQAQASN